MSESNSGDKTGLEQELTVRKDTTEQLADKDSGMATGGPPGEVQAGMTGATRLRFQLRSTDTRHKYLEDFKTALASMELDVNLENDTVAQRMSAPRTSARRPSAGRTSSHRHSAPTAGHPYAAQCPREPVPLRLFHY
jgi:hypothetical protein